jgi:hypothetical protein
MSFDIPNPFKKDLQALNPGFSEDIFAKAKLPFRGGGGGGGARRATTAEPEEKAIPLLSPQPQEEKKEKVVLRNPKWEADWSNLFFIETVKALAHVPKVLVFANCCLTCSTSTYADAWNAKGTRWYIGWAVPVDDQPAVNFAKAFYQRWMEQYKMDPDKVKDAFNDVKGPYASYRPRIFGA